MPNLFKAIVVSALSVIGIRTERQPAYTVQERVGEIEIRQYAPRLSAETTVDAADDNAARSEAFNILAGYIFGKNYDKREIAMTAPVETTAGRNIEMTAPVETSADQSGKMTMRFFLPTDITPSNAPVPNDTRVRLVEIPAQTIAALRFSGSWTAEAITEKQNELIGKLKGTMWATIDRPFVFFYDPPFTLPPLRRNEAAVLVRPAS
jgi:SOUL heme-binding protein